MASAMGRIHCVSLVSISILWMLEVFNFTVSTVADDTVRIAAILDMNTTAGKASNMSLHFALEDINSEAANGIRFNLTIRESRGVVGNVMQVFSSPNTAILVQDPKISKFLGAIAEQVKVPILSFGGAHGFGVASESTYLLSTTPNRYDDMKAVAAITTYYKWKSVVVVYEDDELWLSGVYALTEALHVFQEECENRTTISRTAALSSGSRPDQINETLAELNNTSAVRVFIVHMSVDVALNMFSIAQKLGMMSEGYVWVVTDSVASSFDCLSSSNFTTLEGIVGVKSVATPQFTELRKRLQVNSSDDGVNRIGIQAYSSLKLVAIAIGTLRSNDTKIGGERLHREIVQAISGPVSDNLEVGEYEIINVVGKYYKTVGFWRKDSGRLQSAHKEDDKLGTIIWPGDTAQVPNGFRKLVIGKINMTIDKISEFTNDEFQAVVETLPYKLPFVYKDFDKGNSTQSSYDALINYMVHKNGFDAVVGDATILWRRSLEVEFTQPYTQTGLVMMVPIKRLQGRPWTFLHPFTAELWAATGAFLAFTAFLVWLMEHEGNDEFKGKIHEQVVTSLTLSVNAFVFAQREQVKSALGKGIVATWLLIALILNNSYTAHLTSILTVKRLVPTITNMESLTTSNVPVGYLNGSFVKNYLIDDLKIPQDRLVPLVTPHDYVQKLESGEVGAIVDESPYVQIVRSLYPCANFKVEDRGYFDTGGFGFFFPKGSPFLSDMSEAVLNTSEQYYMVKNIHWKWSGETTSCPDMETGLQSNSTPMTPTNLWILFVFTASIYASALLIHIGRKLYQSWQGWKAAKTQEFSTHVVAMIESLQSTRPQA